LLRCCDHEEHFERDAATQHARRGIESWTEYWDDKQSGGKKYMTFVYADKIEFLGESQRDGQKGELIGDQSNSQEDLAMITDSDVPF
jgi:hypothetical protein